MSKNLTWRAILTALLIFVAVLYIIPSLPGGLPQWWSSALPQSKVKLGLDLQGGMLLQLQVEVNKAIESEMERTIEDMKTDFRSKRMRFLEMKRDGSKGIDVTIMRKEDRDTFADMMSSDYPDYQVQEIGPKGTGIAFKLILKDKARKEMMKKMTEQSLETIRNRIDQFGVNEPDIRTQEGNRILIQLPGIRNVDRAKKLIGERAQLTFQLVDDEHNVEDALRGDIPPGREIMYERDRDPVTGRITKIPYLLQKRVLLTGRYITNAQAEYGQDNEPVVNLTFDRQGSRIFARITGDNVNRRLAMVLDNNVLSAPVIKSRISGTATISGGGMTLQQSRDLAIALKAGSLPAPVKFIEETTVGPSLGKDSIRKGLNSMLIGGLVVIVFMAVYYSYSGIIADIALLLNVLFIMSGLAYFGATLTLPGIAGIILTIGMSVDANVLIFERMREELRLGKTARTVIDIGYSKAVVTIIDSNVTTFIAALVLFQFGTGAVKGFAVTLSIGIAASFITAVFVTRVIYDYFYTYRGFKKIHV